jgi:hypothetical protein
MYCAIKLSITGSIKITMITCSKTQNRKQHFFDSQITFGFNILKNESYFFTIRCVMRCSPLFAVTR